MFTTAPKPETSPKRWSGLFNTARQRNLLCSLVLFAATIALYNPASRNGFINFDDDRYVTANQNVTAGLHWHTAVWAFTSVEQANWHPLTWLSHALDCQIFHLNPAGHHLTSILLHAANVVLLFLILQWLTASLPKSFFVAALFAVHPLNVESVAWIAERKTVLSMFFLLLALASYGWYVRKPGLARYLLIALLFALALMAKPMAITFPLLLLILDYWPLCRLDFPTQADSKANQIAGASQKVWKLCLEKLPLLALSAASALITVRAQHSGGALLASNVKRGWPLRIENVIVSYAAYIKKIGWPSRLSILYPFPRALPAWQVFVAAVFLAFGTFAVIKYCGRDRHRRYVVAGWFWYLVSMLPMIGLIQVGTQAMADRYAYLPGIGIFIVVVWGIADLAGGRAKSNASSLAKVKVAFGVLALLGFSLATRAQINYWRDDLALWSHALSNTHDNFVAEDNYGEALVKLGHADEAVAHFRSAAQIEPGDPVSQLNLGIYAQLHGDLQQAEERYRYVLQLAIDPQLRASAYANLGTIYFQKNEYEEAQRNFELVGKWKRIFPLTLLDMGVIAERRAMSPEDWQRAAEYYSDYVDVDPNDIGYLLLTHSLLKAGREAEARIAYQKAAELSHDMVQTRQRAEQTLGHRF